MKFIAKVALVLVFSVAVVAVGGTSNQAKAHDGHEHEVAQAQSPTQNSGQVAAVYSYTAQAGDTYSHIARKAVQTYGKVHAINLSLAQIVYAETNLTQNAGSPLLEAGQKVELKEDTIKQWVEKAKALSSEEQAAWDFYVQFVDFNTDAVGQGKQV